MDNKAEVVATLEYKPCDGRSVICQTLKRRLQGGYSKGLNSLAMFNFETSQDLAPLLCYKTTAQDNGVALNFCPFCGKPLNLEYLPPLATPEPSK